MMQVMVKNLNFGRKNAIRNYGHIYYLKYLTTNIYDETGIPIFFNFGFNPLLFSDPIGFGPNYKFDFAETETERARGWNLNSRCGQTATSGSNTDQRNDPRCPNVLLINTDDMAWGDVSINNPSKLVPTPNIDRLVSKLGCSVEQKIHHFL